LWSESLPDGVKGVSFQPEAAPPEPDVFPTTIDNLYWENGNQAGFWVIETDRQPNTLYHIKTLGGKTSGPLVAPFDHEIIADYYCNGELRTRDIDLTSSKERRTFLLIAAPDNLKPSSDFLTNI